MKSNVFDSQTSRIMVGHERALVIEKKAREDAEKGTYDPPPPVLTKTYWDKCQDSFELVVYHAQYTKRLAKKEKAIGENTPVNEQVLDIIKSVMAANETIVNEFSRGKEKAINILIGLILRAVKENGIVNVDAKGVAAIIKDQVVKKTET